MRFAGKRVLVTGGARGIGAAAVEGFLKEGAHVAIGARSQASYDAFARAHPDARIVPALGEIGSRVACAKVVAAAEIALGGLDILVNSAGYFAEVPVEEIDQEHWDRIMETNVAGTFFCSQAALPELRKNKGNIVNVASDAGLIGYPLGAAYSASKAAVINLSRAMVLELARDIRINCVAPGNVDTDMIAKAAEASGNATTYLTRAHARSPMQRMATPQEVADTILYLASEQASFVNGAILSVDGGGVCGF
ncbi:SDR family NAD(P)-dependent oxidoreductase [Dongia rigui]|uniref:SDR family oxidoreductase n=1 Tax=Dongia rigui TaxID=940149 RepID=A0ABU5E0Q5_9PROT|nr:SDR family oxidoreductase [Dongia rigui]MDY0873182.1 SDR family oxidoreductase [Dongia rigui]